uniref:protein-tyrosine-phosphatase n=1 Tax=Macrostomum lignano TaxID=282301 RepID=A0A1I8GVY0_9PLAT
MPGFRLKFQRKHRYDISAKGYFIVSVTLLDGTTIDQTVTSETCGKDCINFVAQKIGIRDVNYFGLQYQSPKGQRWVNLSKPVKRQLDKYAVDHSLRFGVMFFVEDPYAIVDDVARELYYLQLRYNLLSGLIPCSLSRAITLAAYGFQVDFGDCSQANLSFDYLLDYRHISNDLMPVNDSDYKNIVEEILKQYQMLEGTDCKMAQCIYIELIQKNTPHFGVAYFPAKTRKGQDVKLGLSQRGVRLFGNADMGEVDLRWSDIASFQAAGRNFSIARNGGSGGSNLQLRLDDPKTAKYVLQYCAQLHAFYINYCARVVTPPQQQQQTATPITPTGIVATAVPVVVTSATDDQAIATATVDSTTPTNTFANRAADFDLECPASKTVRNYLHSLESDGLLLDKPQPPQEQQNLANMLLSKQQQQQQQQIMTESGDYDQPQFLITQQHHQQPAFPLSTIEADDCYDERDYYPQQQQHHHLYQHHIYDNLPQPDLLLASGVGAPIGVGAVNKNVTCSTPDLHHLLSVLDKGETQLAHRLVRDFQQTSAAAAAAANASSSTGVAVPTSLSHHHSTPNLHNPTSAPTNAKLPLIAVEAAAVREPPAPAYSASRCYENLRPRPSSNRLPAKPPAALALTSSNSLNNSRQQFNDSAGNKTLHQAQPIPASRSRSLSCSSESSASSSSSSSSSASSAVIDIASAAAIEADAAEGSIGTESFQSDDVHEQQQYLDELDNDIAVQGGGGYSRTSSSDGACSVGEVPINSSLNVKPSLTVSTANLLWEQSELSINYMPRDERRQQLEEHRSTVDLAAEFHQIETRSSRAQCLVAKRPHNAVRNRCQDAVPYDHNRFALSGTADNPDGYYNASQVEVASNIIGADAPLFIAAESPRQDTRADFWRLAWESGARIVAQLCGQNETARYHPGIEKPTPGEKLICDGAYEVQLVNSTTSPDTDYSIATLAIRELATGRARTVWLFVYPIWTPCLVPASASQFLMFLDEVDSLRRLLQSEDSGSRQTVLLHCPDGSGRTGLAICLLVYKACLQHNQSVSLSTVLCSLRGQRMSLVQSLQQYEFVYDALIRSLDSTRLI